MPRRKKFLGDILGDYRRVLTARGFSNSFQVKSGQITWTSKDSISVVLDMKVGTYMGDSSIIVSWSGYRCGQTRYGLDTSSLAVYLDNQGKSLITSDLEKSIDRCYHDALRILRETDDAIICTQVEGRCAVIIATESRLAELLENIHAADGTWIERK